MPPDNLRPKDQWLTLGLYHQLECLGHSGEERHSAVKWSPVGWEGMGNRSGRPESTLRMKWEHLTEGLVHQSLFKLLEKNVNAWKGRLLWWKQGMIRLASWSRRPSRLGWSSFLLEQQTGLKCSNFSKVKTQVRRVWGNFWKWLGV